ncbi:MAG: hypothetical protein ACOYYS_22900 [Chloroflexota bacterium]
MQTAQGTLISYTYQAAGIYTAIVTATNGIEWLAADTTVWIDGLAPTVTITTPMDGQVLTGTVYIISGFTMVFLRLSRLRRERRPHLGVGACEFKTAEGLSDRTIASHEYILQKWLAYQHHIHVENAGYGYAGENTPEPTSMLGPRCHTRRGIE